jgi:hypothetical protein
MVLVLKQFLEEAGYSTSGLGLGRVDLFDAMLESVVMDFQRDNGLDDDGVVGPKTWCALERAHVAYISKGVVVPGTTRSPWVLRLQSALDLWASGKVGYGTPSDSRVKMMKRALVARLRAEFFKDEEESKGIKFGTTNTCGGCSSFASRVLALILGDTEHRGFTNQCGCYIPRDKRAPQFEGIADNIADAMCRGDQTWDAGEWNPTCRGYADMFIHKGPMSWDQLETKMADVPFAMLHLSGGHVITAFTVASDRGWWYTDPRSGLVLPDGCWILAADGWSGAVGQPTTLQKDHDRLSKKNIDHLWCLMNPGGYAGALDVRACLEV